MTDAEARSVINTFKEMGIASKLEEHRISLQKRKYQRQHYYSN